MAARKRNTTGSSLSRTSASERVLRDKLKSSRSQRENRQELRARKCAQQLKNRGRCSKDAITAPSKPESESHSQPETKPELEEDDQPPLPMETVFLEAFEDEDVDGVMDLKTEMSDPVDINDPTEGELGLKQPMEPTQDFSLYMCKQCDKMFASEDEVKKHISQQKELYSCKFCRVGFCDFSYLSGHMLQQYGMLVVPCFYCHLCFLDGEQFRVHMEYHSRCPATRPSILRQALEATFGPQGTVREEVSASQPQEYEEYQESVCVLRDEMKEGSLPQPQEKTVHVLQAEMKEDSLPQPQEVVDIESEECQNLNVRPLTPSNDSPGEQTSQYLNDVEETQNTNFPEAAAPVFNLFMCEKCHRLFATEVDACRHLSKQKEIYSCKFCSSFFCDFLLLSNHMIQHCGVGVVPCYYCERQFLDDEEFCTHMRMHNSGANYVCPLSECEKTFRLRTGLVNHMVEHKLVPYCCCRCDLVFASQEELCEHTSSHFRKIKAKRST